MVLTERRSGKNTERIGEAQSIHADHKRGKKRERTREK